MIIKPETAVWSKDWYPSICWSTDSAIKRFEEPVSIFTGANIPVGKGHPKYAIRVELGA
jgi:hypothetical protein